MVIDKQPLPEDPTPADAPPAYESEVYEQYHAFDKSGSSSRSLPPSSQSISNTAGPSSPKPLSPIVSQRKSPKVGRSWFPFGQAARAAQEVKQTVLNLLRDVVKVPEQDAALAILANCEEACATHNLSFSSILQDRSLEGHSALYWAIIKHPTGVETQASTNNLVQQLLSMASPLTEETISEIRLACLQNSDQRLFQALRRCPAFAPMSGSDQMLLGGNVPQDEIDVEDVENDKGAFRVTLRIVLFQKRMRITKRIDLEFIARGRMWQLQFCEADGKQRDIPYEKGTWFVKLSLMENSPPTFLDSHLLINDARPPPSHSQQSASPPSPSASSESVTTMPGRMRFTLPNKDPNRPKPTIELRMKTSNSQQLGPSIPGVADNCVHVVHTSLSKSPMGNSLQFDGCSYIAPDGSLSAKLEGQLAKPDESCVIC